ncbi:hypothetical protein EDC96DRAFT_496797 [Choanephora cucurbitarum]|nr:hypothetical protein EDC96DRAFT_496797 [Choanephora cucurbitarum]
MDTNTLPNINQLRNNVDFASVCQFLHTFQSAFKPWPSTAHDIISARAIDPNEYVFETEDLERMILEPSERIRLEDMFVRMLRLTTKNRFISTSTWQTYFSKEFDKREYDQLNPFRVEEEKTIDFFSMDLSTQIHLIHVLCEWQLDDPERLREHLDSEEDAIQWRVDPVGFDRKGSTFWLFDDNRLYKETPKPKQTTKKSIPKKKRTTGTRTSSRRSQKPNELEELSSEDEDEEWLPWKLICRTKQDWEILPQKYANSKHADEKQFYDLLVHDLVPKIVPALEERERELKKQEAIVNRKRSSRIMIRELEALASVDFEDENGGKRASSRLERKQQEREQKEKENLARAREERVLERERRIMEREYRAMAREKRQEEQEDTEDTPLVQHATADTALPASIDTPESKKESPVDIEKLTLQEPKPKRKYTKRLDEHGNPIPRKPKLDADGNPIPLKKRGRKPKNKNIEQEENWQFECICGVSGKNLDDGTPMIACEQCGIWQHIRCLQNTGQIEKKKSLDNISFVCQKCTYNQQQQHSDDTEQPQKRQKIEHEDSQDYRALPPSTQPPSSAQQIRDSTITYSNKDQTITQSIPSQLHSYQSILPTPTEPETQQTSAISNQPPLTENIHLASHLPPNHSSNSSDIINDIIPSQPNTNEKPTSH